MGEFGVATSYRRLKLQEQASVALARGETGYLGPPPATEAVANGTGTILNEPGMLWCEDVWNESRDTEAEKR